MRLPNSDEWGVIVDGPARLTERLPRAVERARQVHGAKTRRGLDVPYLAHVMGVAAIVLNDGGTEDEAIAALLHDTVEDHPDQITFAAVGQEFGPGVAQIVEACTEPGPSSGSWQEQKQRYIDHIACAPGVARRVILADKLDNARSVREALARWGPDYWRRFKSPTAEDLRWYHRALRDRLANWPPGPLHEEFNRLVDVLDPLLAPR